MRTCAPIWYTSHMAKISVRLSDKAHQAAKVAAMQERKTLMQWVEALVLGRLGMKKAKAA